MRVLLVEPQYRRGRPERVEGQKVDEESLWYPPLGLMKLSRYHKERGDQVLFAHGIDKSLPLSQDLFGPPIDRIYVTTLFTFHFDAIVKTIKYYKELVSGTSARIFVGGIMASLMPDEIFEATGIFPIEGIIKSSKVLDPDLDGVDIDSLAPDYDLVDSHLYAVNNTYYGYTTRGCVNQCDWCGVRALEPKYVPYIDIKPMIKQMRAEYGDKPILKLMDNNVLASPRLGHIIEDLLSLGYGRGQRTTDAPRRGRVIDFNQGVDASFMSETNMALLAQLNVRPLRVAFDRIDEKAKYVEAVDLAAKHGFTDFSNYMLFNFDDSPFDLYERLLVNIRLNEKFAKGVKKRDGPQIYSYPMRYAPIYGGPGRPGVNKHRDFVMDGGDGRRDWLTSPRWTRRFIRSIEIMKGAAHGAISPTPSLALRTIGETPEEFLTNLYMPEVLLRERNKHEKRVYKYEPSRPPGTGAVEDFRLFMLGLLRKADDRFRLFHEAVSGNSVAMVRKGLEGCRDKEIRKWLALYDVKAASEEEQ